MKKTLSWLGATALVFSVLIISCSKSNDPAAPVDPPVVTPPVALLDSVVEIQGTRRDVTYFDFNKDSSIAAIRVMNPDPTLGSYGTYYVYNAKKQLDHSVGTASGAPLDTFLRSTFEYDASGLLTMINPGDYRDSLIYNSNKQLIRRYWYYSGAIFYADTLTWSGKNLVKVNRGTTRYTDHTLSLSTFTYKYDDKRNAYSSATIYGMTAFSRRDWLSANNLTELVETSSDGTTNTTTFTYQYNDKNYPVSAIMNYVSKTESYTVTKQFTYKK